jgi:hypothetical protein
VTRWNPAQSSSSTIRSLLIEQRHSSEIVAVKVHSIQGLTVALCDENPCRHRQTESIEYWRCLVSGFLTVIKIENKAAGFIGWENKSICRMPSNNLKMNLHGIGVNTKSHGDSTGRIDALFS